jgi:hypothetical protein
MPAAAASGVGKMKPNTFLRWLKNTGDRRQKTDDRNPKFCNKYFAPSLNFKHLQKSCIRNIDLLNL